jgi:hypothetical protein
MILIPTTRRKGIDEIYLYAVLSMIGKSFGFWRIVSSNDDLIFENLGRGFWIGNPTYGYGIGLLRLYFCHVAGDAHVDEN